MIQVLLIQFYLINCYFIITLDIIETLEFLILKSLMFRDNNY